MQTTWPKWASDFIASRRRKNVAETTIAHYERLLSVPAERGLDLATCGREEIYAYLDWFKRERSPKPSYYYNEVNVIKMVLKFLRRRELNEEIELPQLPDREELVKEKLLTDEERRKLIQQAPTLGDRLIFELEDELGPRAGEVLNIRIKDIQFELINKRMTAVITLTGKTGTRVRRVYDCVPDLREYINNHPQRDKPDARLILSSRGKPYSYVGYYDRVVNLAQRIIKRHISPHCFRHSKATADSSLFTDRELMALYGWKSHATVSVYSHLKPKQIDDKDLVLHGLKSKDEVLRPLMEIQTCTKCKTENSSIALYCTKCGDLLAKQPRDEMMQQMQAQIDDLKAGHGFSKDDIRQMVEEYLSKKRT